MKKYIMQLVQESTKVAELSIPSEVLNLIDRDVIMAKAESWLSDVTNGIIRTIVHKESFARTTHMEEAGRYKAIFHTRIPLHKPAASDSIEVYVEVFANMTGVSIKRSK